MLLKALSNRMLNAGCRLSKPCRRLCQATPPMPINDAQTVGVTQLVVHW